ncbi:hypothetical protein [Synechococcus phage DSL-LC03]|nr:hypothetical protein [Synechococcus phage DSL-LC03]
MEELEEETTEKNQPIKLILLKDGTYLISYIEEVLADYGMPNCKLINPQQIVKEVSTHLKSFPQYTDQEEILMSSDSFLTICDPSDMIRELYLKAVSE